MIKILTIENNSVQNGFLPEGFNPANVLSKGIIQNTSPHATEMVREFKDRLKDKWVEYELFHAEITTWAGKLGLGIGLYSGILNLWRWPMKATWNLEIAAAGMTAGGNAYLDGLAKLDKRIERDNVVSIWSLPNKTYQDGSAGMARGMFSQAKNIITVGCTSGNHHVWSVPGGPANANRKVDVLAPNEWTSPAAYYVGAVAAQVMHRFIKRTGSYHWAKVKFCVVNGVKNRQADGLGEADADLALQLADSMIATGV